MRCAIILLCVSVAYALPKGVNLCLGEDNQTHLCKRGESADKVLDRREPLNVCLDANGKTYYC
ncbi:uncharacterized protein PpBr36_09924 [Pyricularia pennisetigena]|uniref:uncharacterized protein n=1 Tax=Pyricularia pennisetigena TaxID=1578925 RepID=UPI001151934C|nr:uncharacterized protein PpBr36_09924 [Pyricularia pennisetigena]TLS22375.1 hypothetical protein PpBr36_09924 [Pyricularia pennisetigena]